MGISEMKVSNRWDDVLATYSLGSCVGVAIYDPVVRIGGLVHCLLPLSTLDPARAEQHPAIFCDTGVAALLRRLFSLGATRERVVAKIAGASCMMDEHGTFRIGERNKLVTEKMLQKNGIRLAGQDVGGTVARSIWLHLSDGRMVIKSRGQEWQL